VGARAGAAGHAARAALLGLDAAAPPDCAVAVGMIDAHSAAVAAACTRPPLVAEGGGALDAESAVDLNRRLCLIAGTSSCGMALSRAPRFVPGVWGPYADVVAPGWALNEAGQTATGAAIAHVARAAFDPRTLPPPAEADPTGDAAALRSDDDGVFLGALTGRLRRLADAVRGGGGSAADGGAWEAAPETAALARHVHVQPDFAGNRSPHAAPALRGAVVGGGLGRSADAAAVAMLAATQAVAYGAAEIVGALNRVGGYQIDTIVLCGGDAKSLLFTQTTADATGCTILVVPDPGAAGTAGAALMAACAANGGDVAGAMAARAPRAERAVRPSDDATVRDFHGRKAVVFAQLRDFATACRTAMDGP